MLLPFDIEAPVGLDLAHRTLTLRASIGRASHEYPLSRVSTTLSLDASCKAVRLPFVDELTRRKTRRLLLEILVDVPLMEPRSLRDRLRLCEASVGLVSNSQALYIPHDELRATIDVPGVVDDLPPLAISRDDAHVDREAGPLSASTSEANSARLAIRELEAQERRVLALRTEELSALQDARALVERRIMTWA